MRTLMHVRRRGGARDRHQPDRRDGPGQLPRPQRRAEPAVRHARSPASTCSRTSAAIWPCSPASPSASTRWAPTTKRFSPSTAKAGRAWQRGCEHVRGTRSTPRAASTQRRDRRDRRALRRGQERRLQLDDGHHASRPRRAERAGDRQPGPAARHGRPAAAPACCRSAATRTCRASARSASRPSSRTPSSSGCRTHFGVQAADARRASTRWPASKAAHAGELKFGFCLGGNLYGSNPDAAFAARGARPSSTRSSI